jgi:septal ring factor EnvC (AmiA/AmiB activator)
VEAFIEGLLSQGGGYVLAGLALIMLNEVWKSRINELKERLMQERDDKAALLAALKDNTAALVDFRAVLAEMRVVLTSLCKQIVDQGNDLAAHRLEEERWLTELQIKSKTAKAKTEKPA